VAKIGDRPEVSHSGNCSRRNAGRLTVKLQSSL
jgi:hypothetical protein